MPVADQACDVTAKDLLPARALSDRHCRVRVQLVAHAPALAIENEAAEIIATVMELRPDSAPE